ncbi:MAG: MFS transporter [Deltaproteobacteria bacterium]|nr:MFS transporter [Deltaproteobacteria bacterium]
MPSGKYIDTLKHPGFQPFLWTQFLGALNDNTYKMVLSLIAVNGTAQVGGSGYLSLVAAIFILPFILFSGYAGQIADLFSKRNVLVVTKIVELVAMALGIVAFSIGRIEPMFGVLFLMALHATFFSPAKYGILPEMLPDKDLSRANGALEMTTFLAIILGTSTGGLLLAVWKDQLEWIGIILTCLAAIGTLSSLGIPKVPPSGAAKPFRANPWAEIGTGVSRIRRDKTLWLTILGISYFWFLGALLQLGIILFGKELMGLDDLWIGLLGAFLAIGIGLGSLAAGRLSGDKVELGLVPLGAIGMSLFSFLLSASTSSYVQTSASLALLGFSGGLFIVPLFALVQQRSGREEKGQMIATTNFLSTVGILLASLILWTLHDLIRLSIDRVMVIFGGLTLATTLYVLRILPEYMIRFSLWLLTHSIYRIRIAGQEHLPFRGPAFLVCNHVSHVDALLVGACAQRFIRFMVYRPYYEIKGLNWLFRLMKAIPVSGRNRREIVEAIDRAREELRNGHMVCIFAEGAISRTGNLLPFKRGFEKILEGMDVSVIPVHLDRLWGSIFSFKDGRFFWKWPRQIPYPVTISFGSPLPPTANAGEARQAILELGSEAVAYRRTSSDLLPLRFLKSAKRRWFSVGIADSSAQELSYGSALVGSLLLSRIIRKRFREDSMLGVLLPASTAGALANIAALVAGKVPVNLNFTAGPEVFKSAIEQCGIKKILTSRRFLSRIELKETQEMIFLEDLMKEFSPVRRSLFALWAFVAPSRLLEALHYHGERNPDALATVIFSSGSTGRPKGVMLSHHNIISNIEAFAQVFWVTPRDRLLGVLPFFHSFGFTGTLWFPLTVGLGVAYHPNPTDAVAIGRLARKYRATIFLATPTFCATYIRRCAPEDFSSLRYPIVGAEKLRESVANGFKDRFGLDLLEGYGCTEMGPVVSVNVPDVQYGSDRQAGFKRGTVGHPIPGVAVKVVDAETGSRLEAGEEGLLLVKGPSRMMGYLGQPEKTAEALKNGWYVTGDVASIDNDGFIRITDRLSRFSKIGGEMIPHLKIEEAARQVLGERECAVTGIPDEHRGERLVLFHTQKEMTPDEIWESLNRTDLPKLWIPRRENIHCVDNIPMLGSGKLDLKKLKSNALETSATKTVPH